MTTERKIAVQYDVRGNPFWESLATPTDDSCAVCYMVPDRIIPIVFILNPAVTHSLPADFAAPKTADVG
jgi:hypothetical protein